jgi:hypothetical protein
LITCIDISVDNTLLASGANDSTARIWNLETGKLVAGPFKSIGFMGAIQFSPNSEKLAVKSIVGKYLEVWDIRSQKLDVKIGQVGGGRITYAPLIWTNNPKNIIAAFSFTTDDARTIYKFDASTLEPVGSPFEGHADAVRGLALSFDGTLLVSASRDYTIKLWGCESRQLFASFEVHNPHILVLSPDSRQIAYTTYTKDEDDYKICICDTPLDVLAQASIRIPCGSCANIPLQTVTRNLPPFPINFARCRTESESWTDRHTGTSRIQPTDMWQWPADTQSSSVKMWGQHFEQGFQSLHQNTLHSNRGPTAYLQSPKILPVIALLPPSRIPSSTVYSRLPRLRPDPRELLLPSFHTHTVFSARNVEPNNLPPEATLQDLSKCIIKDGEYPVARGGFGEIWKCTYYIDRSSVKVCLLPFVCPSVEKSIILQVAVKALQVYADDQLGAAKMKKIKASVLLND